MIIDKKCKMLECFDNIARNKYFLYVYRIEFNMLHIVKIKYQENILKEEKGLE